MRAILFGLIIAAMGVALAHPARAHGVAVPLSGADEATGRAFRDGFLKAAQVHAADRGALDRLLRQSEVGIAW